MICFDWWFPEAARTLALNGADIICHPANLVLPDCQKAMVTRSLENAVYTVTANRVGSESRGGKEELVFTGGSQVLAPNGERLLGLSKEKEEISAVQIDVKKARDKSITSFNDRFKDRRPEFYYTI
jgi:predicted amidohydrolase